MEWDCMWQIDHQDESSLELLLLTTWSHKTLSRAFYDRINVLRSCNHEWWDFSFRKQVDNGNDSVEKKLGDGSVAGVSHGMACPDSPKVLVSLMWSQQLLMSPKNKNYKLVRKTCSNVQGVEQGHFVWKQWKFHSDKNHLWNNMWNGGFVMLQRNRELKFVI